MSRDQTISEIKDSEIDAKAQFPLGCGEMAELIRQFDWSKTSLGPIELWDDSLKMATNLILSSTFPMAILWGKELIFLYNDGYRSIINHKHPNAMGKSTSEIWPEVWSFNKPIFERVMENGSTIQFENQLFRIDRHWPDEETYFTLCYSPIRLLNNTIGGTLVVLQETTRYVLAERQIRENEQLLRNIIDSTPSHIFAVDMQNQITIVNKALANFCHLSNESIKGKKFTELFQKNIASTVEQNNQEVMRTGITRYMEEEIESKISQKKILVMSSKFPIRDETGKIIRMGAVSTDISDRKKLENELKESKNKAENLAYLKSKFLDTAAHELRTPVTVIVLIADMLQRSFNSDQINDKSKIKKLKEETSRLKRLIDDLLDVSRLERGLMILQLEKLNLVELIEKCMEDFRLLNPQRNFIFAPTLLPIEISVDRLRITQVIMNLLDNAIKYTPEEASIKVTLGISKEKVIVSIIDEGPGIDKEALQNLFKAFSRGNAPLTNKVNGMGLGLSVSKGIIELHGGKIGVKSELNKGSVFYFEIPLHKIHDQNTIN